MRKKGSSDLLVFAKWVVWDFEGFVVGPDAVRPVNPALPKQCQSYPLQQKQRQDSL
jgi:hypothetical protein